ncbi:SURF4 family-domain-containing protein [Chytriomyces sp. MP71]|nr:SURF4 family-domain-containing protein [Chytriomyces sp. MP71]
MHASVLNKFESHADRIASVIRPHVPAFARFLIIATFYEDSLRLCGQWGDQIKFLKRYRGFPLATAEVFLVINIATMLIASTLLLCKKASDKAALTLLVVIMCQSAGYGIIFDVSFIFRMLSVCGGLILLLAEASIGESRRAQNLLFTSIVGDNLDSPHTRANMFQLGGRVLYVFLFLSFLFGGETGKVSSMRVCVVAACFVACVLVAVGFRAKYSSAALTGIVTLGNLVLNSWWSLHHAHPRRDLERYDFFQNLSIIGGLLLLQHLGPGALSVDEKKKNF